ncbi:6-cysteine protein [Plasmodium brasilianum]|uniref:6-cysteine protein n=1 Tax=Plasmodium brasilianum TaxID=5824 RepID=A0ACB9Y5S3_PLABR|nr:6-cysteine protein [Plasmodium brasilianum]
MSSSYMKKFYFILLICKILLLKVSTGDDNSYVSPKDMSSQVTTFLGFKCNFSTKGVHNLEPDILENRSILCSIHSYFIYDKIRLTIPKGGSESKFKILPEKCFETVYTDMNKKNETKIDTLGLVDYEVKEDKTSADSVDKILTISPFNNKDVEFFCLCDNTKKVVSNIEGRSALIHVRVLKYPYDIILVNLTKESYPYLADKYNIKSFNDKKLNVQLKEGDLLVLACEQIDKKCFQKSHNNGELYKSNKIVYHKNFTIFKAPIYITTDTVNAECSCKVDNSTIYTTIISPHNSKKTIHGCNFSSDSTSHTFTNNIDMTALADNAHITCNVELTYKSYNHLLGISCPGDIVPDCFFQVYQPQEGELEPSKIVYLDAQLNMGNIEYYDDSKGDNKIKIFGLVGSLQETTSFTCICKKDKKTAYMTIKVASAYYGFLARIFILLIVLILLYI